MPMFLLFSPPFTERSGRALFSQLQRAQCHQRRCGKPPMHIQSTKLLAEHFSPFSSSLKVREGTGGTTRSYFNSGPEGSYCYYHHTSAKFVSNMIMPVPLIFAQYYTPYIHSTGTSLSPYTLALSVCIIIRWYSVAIGFSVSLCLQYAVQGTTEWNSSD